MHRGFARPIFSISFNAMANCMSISRAIERVEYCGIQGWSWDASFWWLCEDEQELCTQFVSIDRLSIIQVYITGSSMMTMMMKRGNKPWGLGDLKFGKENWGLQRSRCMWIGYTYPSFTVTRSACGFPVKSCQAWRCKLMTPVWRHIHRPHVLLTSAVEVFLAEHISARSEATCPIDKLHTHTRRVYKKMLAMDYKLH